MPFSYVAVTNRCDSYLRALERRQDGLPSPGSLGNGSRPRLEVLSSTLIHPDHEHMFTSACMPSILDSKNSYSEFFLFPSRAASYIWHQSQWVHIQSFNHSYIQSILHLTVSLSMGPWDVILAVMDIFFCSLALEFPPSLPFAICDSM